MIKKILEKDYHHNRLYNSYLIGTDIIDNAFKELEEFIANSILKTTNLNSSSDYNCIKKIDSTVKNISVDQLRKMQNFLNKSSVISGKKVAIIYGADQMNLNAANSCLKILEDTPKNTYIFLLTEKPSSILPTIRSRCCKINHNYLGKKSEYIDPKHLKPLLKSENFSSQVELIKEFSKKDRDAWIDFSSNIEKLISKFCNSIILNKNNLSSTESQILNQLESMDLEYIQRKYYQIKEIIDNTNNFDLNIQASLILIINKFRK